MWPNDGVLFNKYLQVILNAYELCELTFYDLNLRKKNCEF